MKPFSLLTLVGLGEVSKVNDRAVKVIQDFEGYGTKLPNGDCMAYLDTLPRSTLWSPGFRGLWTIGWGSTGLDITKGTIWTRIYAQQRLIKQINAKADEVSAYITRPLNANQFGAVVSLAYNVGVGGITGLLNLINEGRMEEAAKAFLWYDHAGGVQVSGLTRRRYAEKELFEWEVPAEVAKISPIQKAAVAGKRVIAGSAVTAGGMFEFVNGAKQVATDNMGLILLGFGVVGLVAFQIFQNMDQAAFDNGTSTPVGTKPIDVVPEHAVNADIVPTNSVTAITTAPDAEHGEPVVATVGATV